MNETLTKEVLSRLDALAAKLGVGAEHLWAITLKQVQLEAVVWLVVAPLSMLVAVKVLKIARAHHAASKDYYSDSEMGVIFAWILVGAVGFIGTAMTVGSILTLLNPEYYAFKALVG